MHSCSFRCPLPRIAAGGNDAGEINGLAVDHRLAHTRSGLVTFHLHRRSFPKSISHPSDLGISTRTLPRKAPAERLLIEPEWSEHFPDHRIRNVWSCQACGYEFEDTVYYAARELAEVD